MATINSALLATINSKRLNLLWVHSLRRRIHQDPARVSLLARPHRAHIRVDDRRRRHALRNTVRVAHCTFGWFGGGRWGGGAVAWRVRVRDGVGGIGELVVVVEFQIDSLHPKRNPTPYSTRLDRATPIALLPHASPIAHRPCTLRLRARLVPQPRHPSASTRAHSAQYSHTTLDPFHVK